MFLHVSLLGMIVTAPLDAGNVLKMKSSGTEKPPFSHIQPWPGRQFTNNAS